MLGCLVWSVWSVKFLVKSSVCCACRPAVEPQAVRVEVVQQLLSRVVSNQGAAAAACVAVLKEYVLYHTRSTHTPHMRCLTTLTAAFCCRAPRRARTTRPRSATRWSTCRCWARPRPTAWSRCVPARPLTAGAAARAAHHGRPAGHGAAGPAQGALQPRPRRAGGGRTGLHAGAAPRGHGRAPRAAVRRRV